VIVIVATHIVPDRNPQVTFTLDLSPGIIARAQFFERLKVIGFLVSACLALFSAFILRS
jgi:hypothetical protein